MSDINSIITAMFEDKGFDGVEMFNDRYPSMQDNGNIQTHAKPDGAANISFGGSDFAKHEGINYHPDTHGRPNLFLGNSKDYADYEGYVRGGEGKPAIRFGS